MSGSDFGLRLTELKGTFDRTFQQALVEGDQQLVHLLIVRSGPARFALKVSDLAGLGRLRRVAPLPIADRGLLGVSGRKGRMVAVYSLATRIGGAALSTEAEQWFVLCRSDERLALAFTAAERTLRVATSELSPVSRGAPPYATDAIGTGAERLWLLDLNSIAAAIVQRAETQVATVNEMPDEIA